VETTVVDNPEQARYELWADGELAGFTQYRDEGEGLTFLHTQVEPAHEGGGMGGKLVRGALDDVRRRGVSIVPVCSFMAGYIERHPEYRDLVAPGARDRAGGDR
jgi:predicted GNAT family acetyltransferase